MALLLSIVPRFRVFLLLCLLASGGVALARRAAAGAGGELGRPLLQNFTVRDYHAHNQIWATAQDARGILYFGNKNVVLEYDGVRWRKLVIGETTYVRGLAVDPATGNVFLGSVNELGFLRAGLDGESEFVSLRDQLPPEARQPGEIRRVHAVTGPGGGIFFVTPQSVLRWREGRFTVWPFPNASRLESFAVDGRVFIHERGLGLLRLDDAGERFVPASADSIFHRTVVNLLVADPARGPGAVLVGTVDRGLFRVDAGGGVTPFPTAVDSFLQGQRLRRGTRLADGSLALALEGAGLVIVGADGSFRGRINEAAGLQSDTILDLFTDREGGLWLGLNSGLARVEAASALSIFDTTRGLGHTTVRDLTRWDGELVAATSNGVRQLLPADPTTGRPARFEHIPGLTTGRFWSVRAHPGAGGLLAASEDGVFQVAKGDGATPPPPPTLVARGSTMTLRPTRANPDRMFLGGADGGLRTLRWDNGRWVEEGTLARIEDEVRTLVETANGDLWIGTPLHGAYRVRPGVNGAPAEVRKFHATNGLPADQHWTRVVDWHGGDVLLSTQAGLYRFDEPAGTFRVVPDYAARLADGSFMLGAVAEDAAGDLWVAGRAANGVWVDQELGRATLAGGSRTPGWATLPYKIADAIGEIEGFLPEPPAQGGGGGEAVWIGGTDGLVRVDVAKLPATPAGGTFNTVIRRALTSKPGGGTEPITGSPPVLPAGRNDPHFEFAADTFSLGSRVRFATRLDDGARAGIWSDWTERGAVDFNNLPEGNYTFRVRARDVDNREGREAALAFRILPPWHRTAWAYAADVLGAAVVLFGLARWRSRSLRDKHASLEAVVAKRTGDLRAREAELVRARDAAEGANRAKSAFLANMSHELRTPLNAILGYTQILLKDDALSEKNRERLSVVGQSGGHLLAMINEVLDLAKIEAGKLELNVEIFVLAPLLEEVAAAVRPRAAEKGLEFACVLAPDLPVSVRGDAGKLRQVLFNLLGNAVKFTEQGRVELRAGRRRKAEGERRKGDENGQTPSLAEAPVAPAALCFEVTDTGVGIAPGELEQVFKAFHQAGEPGLAAQGTGLGLTISRRLVELLGGRLAAESEPGRGSRFTLELELPEVSVVELAGDGARPAAPGRNGHAPTGFRGPARRLLIVDDEETNRRVMRELLAPLGFEIEEALDGTACLERCARGPRLDLLLLDLRMDEPDGFAVARRLRGAPGAGPLKIIAVSASVFESDRQQALDAGCDDFLPKPFAESQLLAALGRALGLSWVYPETLHMVAGVAPDAAGDDHDGTPSAGEIEALLELAQRGDILKLKRQLAALLAVDGGHYAAFVHRLEPFVAGYQMHRIRDLLLKLQSSDPQPHANGHPPQSPHHGVHADAPAGDGDGAAPHDPHR